MPQIEYTHNAIFIVYHSINAYSEDRIRIPNIVTPAIFESQIRYLSSMVSIIPLKEYLAHVKEGKPLLKKCAIITFDDGYKDNLTIASPILQKYGVPATFFIATGYIGTNKIKWEDRLSCLIRRSKAEVISINLPTSEMSLNITSKKGKFKAINTMVNALGHLNQSEREQILNELEKQLNVKCSDQADVMMTWNDVRRLADTQGFSIGSHTVTHQHLTRISPDAAKREVTYSKEHLEQEINRPVTSFSYPKGDFNNDVIAIVRNAGYTCAGTIKYGQNSIYSDPFRLKRVIVPNQSGMRFGTGMWLRTSPFGETFRKTYNILNGLSRSAVSNQQS